MAEPLSADNIRYALKLAPAEAVEYLRAKGLVITDDWRDLWQAAHTRAFTVAKMAKRDLLAKTREIVRRKLAQGWSLSAAAASLEEEFRKAGWWGQQVAVDSAGGAQVVQLGSPRRIKTILRTNANTAYAAGRYQRQLANAANRPWWRYVAIRDSVTRLAHRQLDGKILRHDDPAWQAIYPPNGFNCRCRVIALTDAQAKEAGADMRIDSTEVEAIKQRVGVDKRSGEILTRPGARVTLTDGRGHALEFTPDPGWAYRPGKSPVVDPATLTAAERRLATQAAAAAQRVRTTESAGRRWALMPAQLDWKDFGEAEVLPGHKPLAALAAGKSIDEGDAIARGVFGVGADDVIPFNTPLGALAIRGSNFRHVALNRRQKREQYANRIPPTLADPDEIWRAQYQRADDGRTEYRLHYIRAYNDKKNGFVVATETPDGAVFFNFIPRRSINSRRVGILLYTRARGRLDGK